MSAYAPGVLDVLARAYDRALDALPRQAALDLEAGRAALLEAILDAARAGVRDEDILTSAALRRIARLDNVGASGPRWRGEERN